MEFVEVMRKAHEMCKDFSVCSNCPIYYPAPNTCLLTLMNEPEKAERAISAYIFQRAYLRRKENATE